MSDIEIVRSMLSEHTSICGFEINGPWVCDCNNQAAKDALQRIEGALRAADYTQFYFRAARETMINCGTFMYFTSRKAEELGKELSRYERSQN